MFKKIISFIKRISFSDVLLLVCLLLCSLSLSLSHSGMKRVDTLDKRVTVIENKISVTLTNIDKRLQAIDVHLAVLDKYASADWEHFYGIEIHNNIESKTKSKKK